METLTKITDAASSALHGDSSEVQSGTEPVSGQTGEGTADAPYDAGNSAGQSGTTGEAMGSSNESATGQPDTSSRTTDSSHSISSTHSGAKPEEMLQGADRPGEEPSSEQVTAIKDQKEHHENIQAGKYPTTDDIGTAGVGKTYGESTGVAADGGDFDAAKPGAGKEAKHLIE